MADAPAPISSAVPQPGQPYDATSDGAVGPWVKLPGGPADVSTGVLTGDDWPDSPPWRQC